MYAIKLMIGDKYDLIEIKDNLSKLRTKLKSLKLKENEVLRVQSSFEETQVEILKQNYFDHIIINDY